MKIEKLHYITQSLNGKSHADMAREACQAGVKWVQLRIKDSNEKQMLSEAERVLAICKVYGAKFIMNDHVELAKFIQADGVHLGKSDMRPEVARKILGDEVIIGGTANTLEDIISLHAQGVDYIGLGPLRFTDTKANLSPILGFSGYKDIIRQLIEKGIETPIIAIGGIQVEDVEELMRVGVHGIAVASLINHSEQKKQTINHVHKQLSYYGEIAHS